MTLSHLFVTQDFPPDLGGMGRRYVELARRAAPDRMMVSTVSVRDDREQWTGDAGEPYVIHRQPFSIAQAKVLVNQMRWAWWISGAVSRGIDLIHCGNVRPCGYAVRLAAARNRMPYLLYVNGGDVLRELRKAGEGPLKRRSGRSILSGAAGIVANSAWTAGVTQDVMARLGLATPPPVATIDLGTDPNQFSPARDTGTLRRRFGLGEAQLLLTVARVVPHKGQDNVLRALHHLRHEFPALRYLVVGTGHDEPRLRALAADLGVLERVTFAGALSDGEIAEAYATSTVYVGLSRLDVGINVEGFGLSFVEAGASGVPSVAGDSGGVRSAVRDGETGFVVPPEDVPAAAAMLRRLLSDDGLRRSMGDAARRSVETHFNWDRMARDTFAFARACVPERPARRLG